MPYNLPPPWDPGFALPSNVRDEGLQRQAFVTKQLPRGTYSMPNVGTGGYAVPDYVMKEGYGQGTFTSKWLPPGSYTVPPIPHALNSRPRVLSEQRLAGGGRKITIGRPYGQPTPGQAQVATSDFSASSLVPLAAAAGVAYLLFKKKGRR